jgi:hypothetical protein
MGLLQIWTFKFQLELKLQFQLELEFEVQIQVELELDLEVGLEIEFEQWAHLPKNGLGGGVHCHTQSNDNERSPHAAKMFTYAHCTYSSVGG